MVPAGQFVLREWQPFVLANLPFYIFLLPAFLELTLVRARGSKADTALLQMLKVLAVFQVLVHLARAQPGFRLARLGYEKSGCGIRIAALSARPGLGRTRNNCLQPLNRSSFRGPAGRCWLSPFSGLDALLQPELISNPCLFLCRLSCCMG